MRKKPSRRGDRQIDFFKCRVVIVFVFIFCSGWIVETALIAIQFRAEPGTHPDEASQKFASFQTDSGVPVGSGDRAKRCLSEGAAPQALQPGRRCVETSGDVIRPIVNKA